MKSFPDQIRDLGYSVTENGNQISFPFKIETGKRVGEEITLGLVIHPDVMLNPPSGPHVRPRLFPIHPEQDVPHPFGGVHESPFGSEWQYWSRPMHQWAETRRNAADYMAHIHRLFETI
jgi:hypothetical protein